MSVSTRTLTETQTTTETVRLASVYGRLFFDCNGVQDVEEPVVSKAKVQWKDNAGKLVAEAIADSAGDYKLEDVPAGSYSLYIQADSKFKHMCNSAKELGTIWSGPL